MRRENNRQGFTTEFRGQLHTLGHPTACYSETLGLERFQNIIKWYV